jgi:AAA15 family ATPase/GTPase
MLSEYQIHNFKAFANQEKIPIRPITLIYGQNSSGKSSVLQSLLLLKQTLQEATDPQTLLLAKGNLVDLGNFSQYINNHDLDKSFSFKVFFDLDTEQIMGGDSKLLSKYLSDNSLLGLEISFNYDKEFSKIKFDHVDLFVGDKLRPLLSYIPSIAEDDNGIILNIDESEINFKHSFWQFWWQEFKLDFSKMLLSEIRDILERKEIIRLSARVSQKKVGNELQKQKDVLKTKIEQLDYELKEIKSKVEDQGIGKLQIDGLESELSDLDNQYLLFDTLLQLQVRFQKYSFQQAEEDFVIALRYSHYVLCRHFLLNEVGDWQYDLSEPRSEYLSLVYEKSGALKPVLDLTIKASTLLRGYLENLVYIRPLRSYPERLYIFGGNNGEQVGQGGKNLADVLYTKPDVLNAVNKQFELFDLGYEIKISKFKDEETSELSDVFAIRLIDRYTKVNVSLLDVGFGISQILPVIIQSVLSRNKTIVIEQPEIHIHPRLQAQLGSLLAESVKSFGNRFIIETHSEHLLLRLQKLIRNGELSHEDIAVVYVDRGKNGSQCLELRIDSEGDFIDEWPNGFFDEGFNEMFG